MGFLHPKAESLERPGPRHLVGLAVIAAGYAVFCALASARFPSEWDSGNYCLGVLSYDVRQHSPHPPGYILYVYAGRALLAWTHDPHRSLILLSLMLGGLAVFPVYGMARFVLGPRDALWCAALSVFNPISLFYGSVALSTISGLLFGPLVALLALRASRGSSAVMLLSSLALGVAGGFRQDLLVFLCIPWGLGLVLSPVPMRIKVASAALLLGSVAAWLVPMVQLTGGLRSYLETCGLMTGFASRESITSGGGTSGFFKNGVRFASALIVGTGVLGFTAAVSWRKRSLRSLAGLPASCRWVVAGWLLPPLLFFVLAFIHKPGYLLPILPGLVALALASLQHREASLPGISAASVAVGTLAFLFLPAITRLSDDPSGYKLPTEDLSFSRRLYRQFARTCLDQIRAQDELVGETLGLLRDVASPAGRILVVTLPENHFDFRVAMLELPDTSVYQVDGDLGSVESVAVGKEGQSHQLTRSPGQRINIGSTGDSIVWVATFNREIGRELERSGAKGISGPRGSRLWVTEGGPQPMKWSP